tara:strand:- start:11002 stop:11217 length:216 start_codon:yes stop_codon:yes gene_type:complete
LNDDSVEKSFLTLYDEFLKLNLHTQAQQKTDIKMKLIMKAILYVLDDLAVHYYWKEIMRVKGKDDEQEDPH